MTAPYDDDDLRVLARWSMAEDHPRAARIVAVSRAQRAIALYSGHPLVIDGVWGPRATAALRVLDQHGTLSDVEALLQRAIIAGASDIPDRPLVRRDRTMLDARQVLAPSERSYFGSYVDAVAAGAPATPDPWRKP